MTPSELGRATVRNALTFDLKTFQARRVRYITPGDIMSARVGPDPTAGPKMVVGAPRAQNTDPRPKRAKPQPQRRAAPATVFRPAVGSGPTRALRISPGVIERARRAGEAFSSNVKTHSLPSRDLARDPNMTASRKGARDVDLDVGPCVLPYPRVASNSTSNLGKKFPTGNLLATVRGRICTLLFEEQTHA